MRVGSVTNGTPTTAGERQDRKLKDACRDFEAMFTGYLLKSMRKTVDKSEFFGSRREEEIFTDMLDDETCKAASRTGSMGIADMLYKQLSRGEKQ